MKEKGNLKKEKKENLMESRKSKSRNVTGSADGTEELARDGQMEKKKKKKLFRATERW
jgi:hypothetical protein